jgi:uncharacterized phage protein (TIGR01671 family)
MNREIKFRAWDKTKKEMNYKVLVGNTDMNDQNYTCNSILNKEAIEWVNADHICIDLMQYTGLKDKNGVEIYESDIVQFTPRSGRRQTGLIKYVRSGFLLEFQGEYHDIEHYILNYGLVVIGSLQENPELLNN